ncbi:MAG: GNAT family N-acetyltransferase [Clostridiales bacterium]|nr:GNAT family N-acetyltransferase [Clostridiales bacterium]
MAYTLRQAKREDAPLLSELIKSSMITYSYDSGIDPSILDSMHERVEDLVLKLKTHTCLCYFDEYNMPVGTITLQIREDINHFDFSPKTHECLEGVDKILYISRFAVLDSLRGTGLGKDLLDTAFSFGVERGAQKALLHTATSNKIRVEFYKNRGFVLVDSENKRGYSRGLFSYDL